MVKAHVQSTKLVYSAEDHQQYVEEPDQYRKILGDSNYSAVFTGMSGAGKDSCTGKVICNDLAHGRTVIIFDVKMEYTLSIFAQADPVLRDHLIRNNLAGRGYKVNLWVPYIHGMDQNRHFKRLCELHHPNLKIRPFRMLKKRFVSEDTANMSLQKTYLQSMVDAASKEHLTGQSRILNELKENLGRQSLGIDEKEMEGEGWEYLDFEEMTQNGEINVITTYFMLGKNIVSTVSFMIGILNELMTIGKNTHRPPSAKSTFSVVIPELQIIMPKGVKSLQNVVSTLNYSMLAGLLLLRSFDTRLRINLQNLSAFPEDMFSQCRIFVGKTTNPKDMSILTKFGYKRDVAIRTQFLGVGDFLDVLNREVFNVVPLFHKARQREYLVSALADWADNPSKYLFETPHGFLSELIDYKKMGLKFPCTVSTYNRKVKAWIKKQTPLKIDPIHLETEMNMMKDKSFERSMAMLGGKT